jgi:hypothetical protein
MTLHSGIPISRSYAAITYKKILINISVLSENYHIDSFESALGKSFSKTAF